MDVSEKDIASEKKIRRDLERKQKGLTIEELIEVSDEVSRYNMGNVTTDQNGYIVPSTVLEDSDQYHDSRVDEEDANYEITDVELENEVVHNIDSVPEVRDQALMDDVNVKNAAAVRGNGEMTNKKNSTYVISTQDDDQLQQAVPPVDNKDLQRERKRMIFISDFTPASLIPRQLYKHVIELQCNQFSGIWYICNFILEV